jgi:hypothetical protein
LTWSNLTPSPDEPYTIYIMHKPIYPDGSIVQFKFTLTIRPQP